MDPPLAGTTAVSPSRARLLPRLDSPGIPWCHCRFGARASAPVLGWPGAWAGRFSCWPDAERRPERRRRPIRLCPAHAAGAITGPGMACRGAEHQQGQAGGGRDAERPPSESDQQPGCTGEFKQADRLPDAARHPSGVSTLSGPSITSMRSPRISEIGAGTWCFRPRTPILPPKVRAAAAAASQKARTHLATLERRVAVHLAKLEAQRHG